jgi:NhaP-type Na+/H+ or K+/H+ antiporter
MDAAAAELLWKIALIAAACIGAQWLAWRMRWPAVLFLGFAGLLLGPLPLTILGERVIDPAADFGGLLRPALAIAVAILLFESGLNVSGAELRAGPIAGGGKAARRLVLPGALIAMALGALAARLVAGLAWDMALLFGAVMAMTGPDVVSPLLRRARLSGRTGAVLRVEAVVNDALGPLLAVTVYEIMRLAAEGAGPIGGGFAILSGAVIGFAAGAAGGIVLGWGFRRGHAPEFLKAPIVLSAVLGVFVLADAVSHGTGLIAVTVFGLTLANSRLALLGELRRFRESAPILLASGVAVILAASLPAQILPSGGGVALAVIMLLLVRPLTVALATFGAGLKLKERALIAWVAPRGVLAVLVAGFLGAELVAIGRADGAALPPLVFAMMFVSVIAQGLTLAPLARRLNLSHATAEGVLVVGASAWSVGLAQAIAELGAPVILADPSFRRLKPARDVGLSCFIGEVLTDRAAQRLDHAALGHLVAATTNDAYNALACVQFAPELGRHRVWQLAGFEAAAGGARIAGEARGGVLIREGRSFESLAQDWWAGWRFRATHITETYTLEQLKADRPDGDFVLERRPDGTLEFLGPDTPPRGLPGSVIVTFGPARPDGNSAETPQDGPESAA